jgi:hypothetical protein
MFVLLQTLPANVCDDSILRPIEMEARLASLQYANLVKKYIYETGLYVVYGRACGAITKEN